MHLRLVATEPNNPMRLTASERVRHVYAVYADRVGTIKCLLDNQQRAAVLWDDALSACEVDVVHLRRVT